ncbi:MFS transporter [Mycolicibacterium wolinskyi]|uniref:MFS transporter n=1 Tax=Mycolicibacterium wolinskyi TaxID=59750 RepID=A0A132PNF6_9MYCO|nr:MFS transporter [Mycolicibacterium wolinskyi]KWX23845.1 MFS transporter [Mycolicibacterium wolinskyi]
MTDDLRTALPGRAPTIAKAGPVDVAGRMERLPWCRVQRTLFLVIATAWFFDSIDLGAMTFLLSPISNHFALSAAQTGVLGGASFAGMFVGAIGAGALADRFGRQRVFKYSIAVWGLASVGLAMAWDFESLITFRFLLGIGMGAEFPVAAAILAEFMPASKRGRYAALLEGAWPLGFITAGAVSYVLVATAVGWRGFFVMQAVLAVIALFLRRNLPESPRWLASRGHTALADRTMARLEDAVRAATGSPLPEPAPVHGAHPEILERGGLRALLVTRHRVRTLTVWAVWFCLMTGYYGLTTWIGKLLTDSGLDIAKSIGFVLGMALWGVPGFLSAAYLIERIGRRYCLAGYTVGSGIAAFFYGQSSGTLELIIAGSFLQFFFFGMFSAIFAYTPELFPTRSRAAGVGSSTALGRLGSVFGPLAVPALLSAGGTSLVFTTSAVLFGIGALIVITSLPETKHAVLEQLS